MHVVSYLCMQYHFFHFPSYTVLNSHIFVHIKSWWMFGPFWVLGRSRSCVGSLFFIFSVTSMDLLSFFNVWFCLCTFLWIFLVILDYLVFIYLCHWWVKYCDCRWTICWCLKATLLWSSAHNYEWILGTWGFGHWGYHEI